jgi:SAM-dependent methyltransferase
MTAEPSDARMASRTEGIRWPAGERRDARCPVCGAPGPKAVLLEVPSPFPGRDLRRLLDCGACPTRFFADHEPPPETYADNAASVKFYVHQSASIEHMIGPLLRLRHGPGTRLAEIGCGFGFALDFARSAMGWRARGIDDSTAADMGARALGVDIAPALFGGPSGFGGETFDVVLASEVLEHIPEPHAFARDVAALLAPRGTAIFTTPNADVIRREHPPSELLRVLSPGFHHVFFTAATLRTVLERAGFAHLLIEEKVDNLIAYASRAPLDLAAAGDSDGARYREYLAARGAAEAIDPDVRLGLAYRRFKALVNVAAWDEARAAFAMARDIVRQRYGIDLEAPDAVSVIDAVPWDVPMNQDLANLHFERFMAAAPGSIVGLLFFRGSLALGTGASHEAAAFFRAAGAAGNVARSLRLTMAHADGEINDLFHQSFLLEALALADVAPEESVRAVGRVVDGTPPPGVLPALWEFTAREREWLLGAVFARLVDRGHLAAADTVFERLRAALGPRGIDLTQPASIAALDASAGAVVPRDPSAAKPRAIPQDLARVLSARGVSAMHRGHHALACAYFRRAIDAWTARDRSADDDALLTRTRVHLVLALTGLDPEAALAALDALLAPAASTSESCPDDVEGRARLLGAVFTALVNQGAGSVAARLVLDVEAALGSEDGVAPDPVALGAQPDPALDVAFCRAMLALNHERAPARAAAWFHGVREAARARGGAAGAPGASAALVRSATYHEALALADAGEPHAALAAIDDLRASPPASATGSSGAARLDASAVLGVFTRLVNRGAAEVAARLLPDVEAAVGAGADSPPPPSDLAARPDAELDAAFCRAMLAFNHEAAPARAAAWFGSVFEAIADRARRGTASASAQALLWQAGYHRALSLLEADDLPATIDAIDGVRTPPPGIPPGLWPGIGEMAPVVAGAFVQSVNRNDGALPARLAGDIEAALGAAEDRTPDPADLASRPDWALDATFCRAMLTLNHEGAPARAAAWFRCAYEAALRRWRQQGGGVAAENQCWTARYHEGIALARAGDREAATAIARELMAGRSPGMPPVPRALRRSAPELLRGV